MPAPEEQDHHEKAGGDHVGVFAEEEEGELDAVVLRVIAAHELLLGFRQIERQAVALGKGADHEQQERKRLNPNVPAEQTQKTTLWRGLIAGSLMPDQSFQVQRAADQRDAEDRQAQRNLVADDLGAGAQAAEKAVLVVRRPAAEDDAVDRETGDGEDKKDAE